MSKQPSKLKQKTNNKIFLIRLGLALRQASATELREIEILVQKEFNRRSKKCQH